MTAPLPGDRKWGNHFLYYRGRSHSIPVKWKQYHYITNQMGDVCGITDAEGNLLATYRYDEWGNLLAIETAEEGNAQQLALAEANPFRYRSYYHDAESGYYYLQSRYYDTAICRFINADMPEFAGVTEHVVASNLFVYCENEPVNRCDFNGHFSLKGAFKKLKKYIDFSWGKITIKLSRTFTIVVGCIALLYRIYCLNKGIKAIHKLTDNKVATAIVTALPFGTTVVSAEVVAWICNVGAAVAAMATILSFVLNCCTAFTGKIVSLIGEFILGYFAPTIAMAVKMMYYGWKKGKGCIYTIKLLGGASVSFT